MTHTKDEALKLALEALEDMHIVDFSLENLAGWNKAVTAIKQALAAPVQEPVATLFGSLPVYDTPPAAQRKPLTDELLRKMHHEDEFGLFCDYDEFEQIARAIEAAHAKATGEAA